jgi:predicted GTPase
MRAVVLTDANFGRAAIQRAVDYLTVEKGYNIVAAVIIGMPVEGFNLKIPVVFGTEVKSILETVAADYYPRAFLDITEADLSRKLDRAIIASRLGVEIRGADYVITPPPVKKSSDASTINLVGTGEVGKTAVALPLIDIAANYCKPGLVNMQLNAPAYPEIVFDVPISTDDMLSAYTNGHSVSGDHYTVAAAAGVPTCGCSFAGTGFSGVPVSSVVADGVLLLEDAGVELTFVEGAGSSISPVQPDGWVAIVKQDTDLGELDDFANAFSLSSADMIVITAPKYSRRSIKGIQRLTDAIRSANANASLETGRIVPFASDNVSALEVLLVTRRTGEEASQSVTLIEKQLKAVVVDTLHNAVIDTETVSLDPDTVLIEAGVPNLGEWLRKCKESNVKAVLVTGRFVPKEPKSFSKNAKRLIEKALAARAGRR